jgi:type IV pilus assembly protein PilW
LHLRNGVTGAPKRKFVSSLYYIRNFAETAGDGIPTLVRSEFDLAGGELTQQLAEPLIEGVEAMRIELGIDNESVTNDPVNYAVPVDWEDPDDHTTATNRGDGEPDGDYVRCTNATPCTAANLTNVTSVRIHVLARSREPTRGYSDTKTYDLGGTAFGPFGDEFKRHVYTTTIRLPNVAGRRERP